MGIGTKGGLHRSAYYAVALAAFAWSAFGSATYTFSDALARGSIAATSSAPVPAALLVPADNPEHSLNWAGYVAQGGIYTGVSASWVVPAVKNSGSLAADATWVGIGGVGTHDLIQAGTQAIEMPNGDIQYQAWTETLPEYSVPAPLVIKPGDAVAVSIREESPDQWRITISNLTTSKTYSITRTYVSSRSSAEWIEEMPSGDIFLPLSQFGSVTFANALAVQDGAMMSAADAGAMPLTMLNPKGEELALPTIMAEGGSSFTVTRAPATALSLTTHFGHRRSQPVL
ncbi:MAG: hypothetical protein JWO43_67 [Candidatus Adlerbacteria bacterium]|nr:hypothetical protein [Candidatus Adlerbacteria bacterium]